MVYKSLNGLAPQYLRDKFVHRNNISNYSLRDAENKLAIPLSRTNYMKNSFSYSGAVLWNSLPAEMRQADDLSTFRLDCKNTLTGSSHCKSLSHGTHEKQICLISMYCLYS